LIVLEVNTQPGMTPTSLAPEQAAVCGLSYDDLVAWMLADASCPR
jgi:D-alanine-D-alanine ligase